ncbi:MAG: serine hydrolase [Bacteroidia bacterium]|nr:serine hydrolase [Bacteroidia bacterium]
MRQAFSRKGHYRGEHRQRDAHTEPLCRLARSVSFKMLFENGLTGVIPATSDFPLFYEKRKTIKKNAFSPTTLSSLFLGDWLKKQMKFNGLVFVNILRAQDLSGKYRNGESETFAFQAGNDVLLFPQSLGPAVRKIKRLTRKEEQYQKQLDESVRKILTAKYDAGLYNVRPIETDYLWQQLNAPEIQLTKRKLYSEAITVVRNDGQLLPLKNLDTRTIAVLSIGKEGDNDLSRMMSNYTAVDKLEIRTPADTVGIYDQLRCYTTVIIGVYPMATSWQQSVLPLLNKLSRSVEVIVCGFNLPFALTDFQNFPVVVEAYTGENLMQQLVAQTVFGSMHARGELPVNVSASLREGDGINTGTLGRLGYSIPEDAGMDAGTLEKIKNIAYEAIQTGATPGCRVLVARGGKVVFDRAFGWQTYANQVPVADNTVYDLASVTKVSATLQTVMFMYDRGLIDINKKASVYLPELRASNKKDFTIKDILTHQAGLWPFLPFWAQTMKDSVYLPEYYAPTSSALYPFSVADNLYAAASMKDSLWTWIVSAKIREKADRTPFDYRYSDMGFYIMQHLAEKMLNQPMEVFLEQNLYEPLGASTMGYLPRLRFPKEQIAPTEDDKLFRKSLLVGMVHDQGAAMHGGIAGHAGLFSDANDLAKLAQMLLQEGYYGGTRYYKPETVRLFTNKQFALSRRGLGWDKPTVSEWNGPTSLHASPLTFGHTGFTGTCIWVDPEFDLVYIFLSNRVHPDMTNNKLLTSNIRSRIQDVIYESIFNYAQYGKGPCPGKPVLEPSARR